MAEREMRVSPFPMAPLGVRLWRAARLRCPACGGGPLLAGWFDLVPRCPRCGLRTDRGEQDFFLGAMMFNLVLSEAILALVMVAVVLVMLPNVPWTPLAYTAVVLMVLAPFVFYPFSKTIWMAFDLLMRPLTPEELEWHRTAGDKEFRPQRHR